LLADDSLGLRIQGDELVEVQPGASKSDNILTKFVTDFHAKVGEIQQA